MGLTPVWHVWAGTALLALVVVRLIVRATTGVPHLEGPRTLMTWAADIGHWVLYALMLAVPVLGAVTWFAKYDGTGNLHILLMNLLMITILGHSAAAMFHQYVRKERVLSKMLPLR